MSLQAERLYYNNSYLTSFSSVVTDVKEETSGTWIRLRESAFYPTSGGQPFDTGTLCVEDGREGLMVTDVQVDDGHVWHRVSNRVEVGQVVTGEIDWMRRFDFMQQHSGQHILSACFEQLLHATTSSFHMGDTYSSIDLDIDSIQSDEMQAVLLEANRWIWRDVAIRARFVSQAELASMTLKKAPAVTEDIRIVTIDGLEDNACGGTHPSSTGQVGQILVTKTERMRGGIRVTFVCGMRALSTATEAVDAVRTLAVSMSVGLTDVLDAVNDLHSQIKDGRRKYDELQSKYTDFMARDYVENHIQMIAGTRVLVVHEAELEEVQQLKRMVVACSERIEKRYPGQSQLIVFVGQLADRTHMVVQTENDAVVTADVLVKTVLPALDGKGGGNAKQAQGSAPVLASELLNAIELALHVDS